MSARWETARCRGSRAPRLSSFVTPRAAIMDFMGQLALIDGVFESAEGERCRQIYSVFALFRAANARLVKKVLDRGIFVHSTPSVRQRAKGTRQSMQVQVCPMPWNSSIECQDGS